MIKSQSPHVIDHAKQQYLKHIQEMGEMSSDSSDSGSETDWTLPWESDHSHNASSDGEEGKVIGYTTPNAKIGATTNLLAQIQETTHDESMRWHSMPEWNTTATAKKEQTRLDVRIYRDIFSLNSASDSPKSKLFLEGAYTLNHNDPEITKMP